MGIMSCVFNIGVCCSAPLTTCGECGWNPEVSHARLAKMAEENAQEAENAETKEEG